MSTTRVLGLVLFILAVIICFSNEVIAAPFFVAAFILGSWDFIHSLDAPSRVYYPEERIIREIQVPAPVIPQQQRTEATEHTFEHPSGAVLTVRKVTRWH